MQPLEELIETIRGGGLEALGLYYGLYPGKVIDNEDPDKRGKLKVCVPQITRNAPIEEWALPMVPLASGAAFLSLPQSDDDVWIAFKNGNPRFPIWTGSYWREEWMPEEAKEDYPLMHTWQSPLGNRIQLNDKTKQLVIIDANKNEVRLQDGKINLTVTQGGTVTINGKIVELNGNAQFAVLGNTMQTEINKLNAKFNALVAILSAWVPVPQDGGAALKTALSPLFQMDNADFSAILSKLVKLA